MSVESMTFWGAGLKFSTALLGLPTAILSALLLWERRESHSVSSTTAGETRQAVVRHTKNRVLAILIVAIEIVLYVGTLLTWFAFKNLGMAILLLSAYVIFASIEFSLRPWVIHRGELVFFVIWVAAMCSIVAVAVHHLTTLPPTATPFPSPTPEQSPTPTPTAAPIPKAIPIATPNLTPSPSPHPTQVLRRRHPRRHR